MEKKWILKVRKQQMLRAIVKGEGRTVRQLAKDAGISVAYAHTVLAELVGEGEVIKGQVDHKRYGETTVYYSRYYYVTELADADMYLEWSAQDRTMKDAQMDRACTAAEWYGFESINLQPENIIQRELF